MMKSHRFLYIYIVFEMSIVNGMQWNFGIVWRPLQHRMTISLQMLCWYYHEIHIHIVRANKSNNNSR